MAENRGQRTVIHTTNIPETTQTTKTDAGKRRRLRLGIKRRAGARRSLEKSAPRNLIVVLATLLPLWALSFSTLAENHGAPALLVYALQALALLGMLNWFFPYVALAEPQAPARETWKSIWRCLRADFGEILSLRLRMLLKFLMPLVLFCALLLALDRQGMLGNALPEPRNLLAYIYAAFVCVAGPYFLQTEAGCAEKVLRESRRVKRAKR